MKSLCDVVFTFCLAVFVISCIAILYITFNVRDFTDNYNLVISLFTVCGISGMIVGLLSLHKGEN